MEGGGPRLKEDGMEMAKTWNKKDDIIDYD
jgi:hypothetical protein